MNTLARYHAANLPELMEKITRNGIGMDDYLNRFWETDSQSNYPPYNLVQLNNHESRLEVALAGFKKEEVKVFTEFGKLHVEGIKEDRKQMQSIGTGDWHNVHSNALGNSAKIAKFDRSYFADGLLTVELGKVVPEHHSRKDYLTAD